jgi:hypothetical protein
LYLKGEFSRVSQATDFLENMFINYGFGVESLTTGAELGEAESTAR